MLILVIKHFVKIFLGLRTIIQGLKTTFKHVTEARYQHLPIGIENNNYFSKKTGIVTLQYPHESIPVPDNGRYRLHNEMDDCIVCDKCVKICPVDCIVIEPIKATEEIGYTSDGSSKRLYASVFDIDMAKCCFCGLCTTVCPTECLTMTKTYDFSEIDIKNMNYHFSNLSPTEAIEKQALYDEKQAKLKAEKEAKDIEAKLAKDATQADSQITDSNIEAKPIPVKKPMFKPQIKKNNDSV